ncbi:MAG TPA: D-alanine--D-alanine ligase family protein [Bacillota bacterium]|jgi:D-alanine-D-alanine ligase|nr:D-alanine--D-alanine ligase [Fastidiosipila sp.]HPX92902.1 D-alanine--D-alanine ligase family protein [Bacillota bacterium]HQB80708.1 D-alanine--D-alanine ligase family protein [Bacillota bacterium]
MESELNVVVLFGGRSGEHEVSRSSAAFIIDTLRQSDRYRPLPVGITRAGSWYAYFGPTGAMRDGSWFDRGPVFPATLVPDTGKHFLFLSREGQTVSYAADCVFPVLHGPKGEDGTLQGMLELAGIPFVGAGMAASALAMDKSLANIIFEKMGIAHTPWRSLDRDTWRKLDERSIDRLIEGLRFPLFTKPARGGSSLGISRVQSRDFLQEALSHAFSHDRKVLIEEGVKGRELEVAALGGYGDPELSPIGEVVPDREFYDYDSKYEEHSTTQLIIPADISPQTAGQVKRMAAEAWRAIDCYGMARIDFFLADDQRLLLSEINTIPGFVSISMYPRLFRAAGYRDGELLEKLIGLALTREDK